MFHKPKCDLKLLVIWFFTIFVLLWYFNHESTLNYELNKLESELDLRIEQKGVKSIQTYNRSTPIMFIGGVPRSGTTLMRAMLDAHPSIRCGEETRIVPRMVAMRFELQAQSDREKERLEQAGVTQDVIDSAVGAFILDIIVHHGAMAPYLCNKDPLMLSYMPFLKSIFPQSRFILMIRDGRATVHSIISRHITISGFNLSSYRDCLIRWNSIIEKMYNQCTQVGPNTCLMVYYEQLVLHPEANMRRILEFLQIEWNDAVLHHEQFIGEEVSVSKTEKSTDQIVKPVNLEALSSWAGHIPEDVISELDVIAPMLKKLGYDPTQNNSPNYGEPDSIIMENTLSVKKNSDYWKSLVLNSSIFET